MNFISKGSLNIPEYRRLFIGREHRERKRRGKALP